MWLARRRAPSRCNSTWVARTEFRTSALSDANWSRGIGLSEEGSLLLDMDRAILCYLKPGTWLRFSGSGEFWESRYQRGETSGGGSYGRLAQFKAQTLNRFVEENEIASVIEFGCGDGHQLSHATAGSLPSGQGSFKLGSE